MWTILFGGTFSYVKYSYSCIYFSIPGGSYTTKIIIFSWPSLLQVTKKSPKVEDIVLTQGLWYVSFS